MGPAGGATFQRPNKNEEVGMICTSARGKGCMSCIGAGPKLGRSEAEDEDLVVETYPLCLDSCLFEQCTYIFLVWIFGCLGLRS